MHKIQWRVVEQWWRGLFVVKTGSAKMGRQMMVSVQRLSAFIFCRAGEPHHPQRKASSGYGAANVLVAAMASRLTCRSCVDATNGRKLPMAMRHVARSTGDADLPTGHWRLALRLVKVSARWLGGSGCP